MDPMNRSIADGMKYLNRYYEARHGQPIPPIFASQIRSVIKTLLADLEQVHVRMLEDQSERARRVGNQGQADGITNAAAAIAAGADGYVYLSEPEKAPGTEPRTAV